MAHQAFEKFRQITTILLADVEASRLLYAISLNDFSRRSGVKTLFTYLEGHLYAFKQATLALECELLPCSPLPGMRETRIVIFSDEEKAMLEEFTYEMSGSGKARRQTYYPRFEDNIRFIIRAFHKAIRLESKVDLDCQGWNQLIESQRIRNRITHPKSVNDLSVTDADLDTVNDGINWYEDAVSSMLERFEKESIYAPRFRTKLSTTSAALGAKSS